MLKIVLSVLLASTISACNMMTAPTAESAAPKAQAFLGQTARFCVGPTCTVSSSATGVVRGDGLNYTVDECFEVTARNSPPADSYYWDYNYPRHEGC